MITPESKNKDELPKSKAGTADEQRSADRTPGEKAQKQSDTDRPKELGGRSGPEPTRYGDWEKAGRCIDF